MVSAPSCPLPAPGGLLTSWKAVRVVIGVLVTSSVWLTCAGSPVTSGPAVLTDPRVTVTVNLHGVRQNWTAVEQSLLPCNTAVRLPVCQHTSGDATGNASLNNMATCPWEVLTDTDPRRIPRDIHYARCICRNFQGTYSLSVEEPLCQENYVNLPYVLCDRDPFSARGQSDSAPSCQLGVKAVAVSCVARFVTQG
ncbi:uncharacterized protein LOC143281410 [Babylonia areolata]|uniref:uncharacterized protein LOC143281410 n=1 Tax=Babylonia areolata TaxID=304850 RepID=UPI003FD1887E